MRIVGGASRKSRKPFAVTDSKASANLRRASSREKSETSSKNTNSKRLVPFIIRNASNNVMS